MILIAPNECICPVCEKSAIGGATHPRCRGRYTPDGLTSFFYYGAVVREAVKSIKYRFVYDLVSEFVSLVPDACIGRLPMNDERLVVVPIPLHSSRLRFRGFNQAEKLGAVLAIRLHLQINTGILTRTRKTNPQVEMKKKEDRLKNMENVFTTQHSEFPMHNSGILLFDDVFTTGATMRAATKELKRAGVPFVWCVTMAR